jgi:hypothetical protein
MTKLITFIILLFFTITTFAANEKSMLYVKNGLPNGCVVNMLIGRCPALNSSTMITPGKTVKINMLKMNTITVYLYAELIPKKTCPIRDKDLASKTYCLVVRDKNVKVTLKRQKPPGKKAMLVFQNINKYHLCKENK